MTEAASAAVERAARTSYGRLVALLAARSGDVDAAEEALAEAFAAALRDWASEGVPNNPEAWLLTAARRRMIDEARRIAVRERAEPAMAYEASQLVQSIDGTDIPDRRLELMFACAHASIDASMRAPLILQAVLGIDAAVIAGAFLTSPSTMAQRLVRAKRKIRDAGIRFEIPERGQFPVRLEAVLEAIYGAFGTGWDAVHGGDAARADLADEAVYLGRLVVDALPEEPEPRGLLAVMLYCEARRAARRDASGQYVPLSAQSPDHWNVALIREAESLLSVAARMRQPGRFQIEAAIQSAHLAPAFGRPADERAISALYDALVALAPTVAVHVNRAAAIARASGPAAGLEAADTLPLAVVAEYQPWWALRAHLLSLLGRSEEAASARVRAAGLTEDPAVRDFLLNA